MADGGGNDRGGNQNVDENVAELIEEAQKPAPPPRFGQLVRPDRGKARSCLLVVEAVPAGLQNRQCGVRRKRLPVAVFPPRGRGGAVVQDQSPTARGLRALQLPTME